MEKTMISALKSLVEQIKAASERDSTYVSQDTGRVTILDIRADAEKANDLLRYGFRR